MGKLGFHALLPPMAIVLALVAPVASERLAGPATEHGPRAPAWRSLGRGAEYAAIALSPRPALGDGLLHVVRVDPSQATIRVRMAAQLDGRPRTAREWCDNPRVVAVINAGMYDRDLSTHIGFLRVGDRIGSARWVSTYRSILLLGARHPDLPAATIRDAPPDGRAADFADYDTVVQNLRLIRDPAVNAWTQSDRRWSEAAIALDRSGRILFLFCRSPLTMHDFNALVTALPLGVTRAMHVEGGSEASLSVRGPGIEVDLSGSYETGFNPSDDSKRQWPLPNVVTVEAGSPRGKVR
ncbi:MAG TPA: phosphodiester glycosidase family protein [Thermoanaerobaculia bacterium]|nr:phosphodiester glycosidase family protein [Thermoanaerobaculia bacterium]